MQLLSKIATSGGHGEDSPYFDGWKAYESDPYHPSINPNGVIQMGLAENQLCPDLIEDWIKKNPAASVCTTEGVHAFKEISNFQDYHGLPKFRESVAKFMGKTRDGHIQFDPDRIVMSGGATGAIETLIFCLANPGDAFLVPSPHYAAFGRDIRWRTQAQIIPVPFTSSNGFRITLEALEAAYNSAISNGSSVKGIVLSNPSNPLGTTMDHETLTSISRFATHHQIHFICDEIYAGSVYASPRFISVAEVVPSESGIDPNLIHIVYSLSKDLGMPGFRVGIVYSFNDQVVSIARKMSSFGLVSTQTQRFVGELLADDVFVDFFLAENARRLGNRCRKIRQGLKEAGIGCLESNSGFFVWMDLRNMVGRGGDELGLWRVIVKEVKLNVSPWCSFGCEEAGWFRVCFANMDEETMGVALDRLRKFVMAEKKKMWRSNVPKKLSFNMGGRKEDVSDHVASFAARQGNFIRGFK